MRQEDVHNLGVNVDVHQAFRIQHVLDSFGGLRIVGFLERSVERPAVRRAERYAKLFCRFEQSAGVSDQRLRGDTLCQIGRGGGALRHLATAEKNGCAK